MLKFVFGLNVTLSKYIYVFFGFTRIVLLLTCWNI